MPHGVKSISDSLLFSADVCLICLLTGCLAEAGFQSINCLMFFRWGWFVGELMADTLFRRGCFVGALFADTLTWGLVRGNLTVDKLFISGWLVGI